MKIYLFILLISTFAFYVCNASDQNNLSWPRILRGEGNQDTARRATLNHLIGHGPSSTNASTPRVQGQGRNNRQREGGNRRNGNRRNVNNPDSRTRGQILQPNNFEHQGRVHQGNNNSNQFNRNNDSRHFAQPVLGVPLYGEAIGYPYQNEVIGQVAPLNTFGHPIQPFRNVGQADDDNIEVYTIAEDPDMEIYSDGSSEH